MARQFGPGHVPTRVQVGAGESPLALVMGVSHTSHLVMRQILIMNDVYFKRESDLLRIGVSVLEHRRKMIEAMGK